MKKFLAIVAIAIPMMAAPVVTYTTTGTFTSTGTGSTAGGALVFTGLLGGGSVDLGVFNPSNASFGDLDTNAAGASVISVADGFTLTINQTGIDVAAGMGTLSGTISGSVSHDSSDAKITFATPAVTINGVTYALGHSTYSIVPSTTNNGITSLQGTISTVPEPGTVGLIGLGLAAVGVLARRRRVC